jgi:hypothetical protein
MNSATSRFLFGEERRGEERRGEESGISALSFSSLGKDLS